METLLRLVSQSNPDKMETLKTLNVGLCNNLPSNDVLGSDLRRYSG
jgi:hypothetical protein